MRTKLNCIAPLLAAAGAAVAIIVAPVAAAADPSSITCNSSAPDTSCVTPGNAQINDSPPPVSYDPYGDMPYLLGRYGGHRGR
ncbi:MULTISPECIES: hypothetical protein [unclassified Mycolicibacterium]|uniref:hypothetical protein n=1 Tax=unclassified Mycolicibacterium TaxID=2636767 RepID=UPI0012DD0AD0|nr:MULTISPECIES: hypothetical protein [unclassified Mycolicibacterium]MUL85324.1 hypothetical protein [Mycolicibacterium sp. CBMA 329]MUL91291.1 hypothetical protein [Mycolicibacterium sp. CBMA 331]MUM02509.1 hypothetical protein [Mycolicibacterium sp. CBMA 334]MUM29320.1 hypothetical protein [Mycolicibacterium sp. CBMA 295]MUM41050.1 hypothetical protein [Mycolicibacterium sp. CBMA 247]